MIYYSYLLLKKGPGGVALLLEILTDNKNRSSSSIRHLLQKYGGNLSTPGSVSWIFERKGFLIFDNQKKTEEEIMEIGLEIDVDNIELLNEEKEKEIHKKIDKM